MGERYAIKGKLGEGGQGSVYRAVDRNLERVVAVKRLVLSLSGMAPERAREELLREALAFPLVDRILARVALDLWSGRGQVQLWDLVEGLDDETYQCVLAGLRHLKPIEWSGAPMVWRQPKVARS